MQFAKPGSCVLVPGQSFRPVESIKHLNSGDRPMKKSDVKIGGEYYAKVTGKKVVVQIDAINGDGGWDATNMSTGKAVRIKTAERLQGPAQAAGSADTAIAKRARKRVAKTKAGGERRSGGDKPKMSCLSAAAKVLEEPGEPMNTQEMIAAMADAGYWTSPGGKTPHATLYSAILRELKKGGGSRFVKVERGRFGVRD
ncbi:winged helix-turn-helix domain-containing protein [Roseiconus nitratireducens]|nr:winged helix-turn-helix domain-containing protein [Roseiconus nitratireducens]